MHLTPCAKKSKSPEINISELLLLVFPSGFEPLAYRLGGDRSILLSYGNMNTNRKEHMDRKRLYRTFEL